MHNKTDSGHTGKILLAEEFHGVLQASWQQHLTGQGAITCSDAGLHLINKGAEDHTYSNAQIDDYQHRTRRHFLWHPPLTFLIRARFSPQLTGTAGFGFWNDPFAMTGGRTPTLPRAIWFFLSAPPSDLALAQNVPGWGWKAATIDAWRWPFLLLAPTAPVAFLLMRIPWLYRRLWPLAQAAIGVSEALLDVDMTQWHTYRLAWSQHQARFLVDEELVLECARSPRGPLGLVLWLDNQYMVVTPQGRFRHGLVAKSQEQWMHIEWLRIHQGS